MSFAVQLANDLSQVDPGASVPVTLEVVNRSDSPDRYEISVEGLDPSWVAVPVPSFPVDPRETHVERFFLKPPRESESLAGTYPFVVNVRSTETGETRSTQGALEVRSFTNFSVDIQPKRGSIGPFSNTCSFDVNVMNLGNGEQTLQMFAADTENQFAFEFEADQVTLNPGQEKALALQAATSKSSLFANTRLQNFTVSARSTENAAIAATSTGQIEKRALATPGALFLLLLVAALITGWVMMWPKPPKIDSLVIEPAQATVGMPVAIRWKASHADSVRIQVGNWVQDRQMPQGEITYTPDRSGKYLVEVTAVSGDRKARDISQVIEVAEPPVVPMPAILDLSVDGRSIELGQPFMLKYRFNAAVTRAVLIPTQKELDVKENGIQLTADTVGKNRLTVKAYNASGQVTESSVTFTVVKLSLAKIAQFESDVKELEAGGGVVTLTFTITGAARALIQFAGQELEIDPTTEVVVTGDQWKGQKQIDVREDTTFKLVAYDKEGTAASAAPVSVKVKKAAPDTNPTDTTTGGGQ